VRAPRRRGSVTTGELRWRRGMLSEVDSSKSWGRGACSSCGPVRFSDLLSDPGDLMRRLVSFLKAYIVSLAPRQKRTTSYFPHVNAYSVDIRRTLVFLVSVLVILPKNVKEIEGACHA
jgi:hypothetical protein